MSTTNNSIAEITATQQAELADQEPILIGVYGPEAHLKALVRTSEGHIRHLRRGSRWRNAKVVAIGPDRIELDYGPNRETMTFPRIIDPAT